MMFKKGDIVRMIDEKYAGKTFQVTDITKDQRYMWVENVLDAGERILTSPSKCVKK